MTIGSTRSTHERYDLHGRMNESRISYNSGNVIRGIGMQLCFQNRGQLQSTGCSTRIRTMCDPRYGEEHLLPLLIQVTNKVECPRTKGCRKTPSTLEPIKLEPSSSRSPAVWITDHGSRLSNGRRPRSHQCFVLRSAFRVSSN